jgi:Transglycosylase SLT domain/Domain of unknown function (DUF4124)
VNRCLRIALFLVCLLPAAAHADLYGYVDEEGQVHFAREQVDARYQLFVKGEVSSDYKMSTDLKYLPITGKLEDHVIYKRIQKTPNVKKYEAMVVKESKRQKLDPALVKAVIAVESAYDPAAVSSKGAVGLMQLIPETAERYGVRLIADPRDNINGGTRYLKDLIDMFGGNLSLALAGYNAGEGAVRQYNNAIPPFPETRQYVKLVMQFYEYFGGRAATITRTAGGRVRVTLPGRRNMPAAPGESGLGELARDPKAQGLFDAPPAAPAAAPAP